MMRQTKRRKMRKSTKRKLILVIGLALLLISTSVLAVGVYQKLTDKTQQEVAAETSSGENNNDISTMMLVKVSAELEKRKTPSIPEGSKIVALTFDDGPGYNSTQRILDILDKYDAKATWFCLGSRVDENGDMLKQISKAGHEVANHSYDHPNLVTLDLQTALTNIDSASSSIKKVIGRNPSYLRPPYGSYNEAIEKATPMGIALWNVDSLDWQLKNGAAAYQHVMSTMVPNPVILFHDIYETSADAVELLVPELAKQGYKFVTYSQMMALTGQ